MYFLKYTKTDFEEIGKENLYLKTESSHLLQTSCYKQYKNISFFKQYSDIGNGRQ